MYRFLFLEIVPTSLEAQGFAEYFCQCDKIIEKKTQKNSDTKTSKSRVRSVLKSLKKQFIETDSCSNFNLLCILLWLPHHKLVLVPVVPPEMERP